VWIVESDWDQSLVLVSVLLLVPVLLLLALDLVPQELVPVQSIAAQLEPLVQGKQGEPWER
jgi:hypothetical protein